MDLTDQSCQVAFATLIRDLDSLAGRAGIQDAGKPAVQALESLPGPIKEFLSGHAGDALLEQIVQTAGLVAMGVPSGRDGRMPVAERGFG